jgi:protein-S-isoprenylcysteine O-methyltransferase Ste14
MNSRLIIKSTLITLLMPGTVILLIPYFILHHHDGMNWPAVSGLPVLGAVTGLAALVCLLHCIWSFGMHGKGTLAPIDPPKALVVQGLYGYTRNPMYLAVTVVLLAEALFFQTVSLLVYAACVFLAFHLFVVFYEEPHLRMQFGNSYTEYCNRIPRWRIAGHSFPK